MKSISNAVRNVSDKDKQRVLAVLGQLAKVLPDWRAAKDLNAKLSQLEANQKEASSKLAVASTQLKEINEKIAEAEATKRKLTIVFAIICSGCLILMYFKRIGAALSLIAGSIWFRKIKTENKAIAILHDNRTSAERNLANANDELATFNRDIALTQNEIVYRPISLPSIQLASVVFPVNLVEIMGSVCALDISGTTGVSGIKT